MNRKEKIASRRTGGGFGLPVAPSQLSQPPRAGLSRLWPNSLACTAAVAWSMRALKVEVRMTRFIRRCPIWVMTGAA